MHIMKIIEIFAPSQNSTDMGILSLMDMIDYYRVFKTSVFAYFQDIKVHTTGLVILDCF